LKNQKIILLIDPYIFKIKKIKPINDKREDATREAWNLSVLRLFLIELAIIPQMAINILTKRRISIANVAASRSITGNRIVTYEIVAGSAILYMNKEAMISSHVKKLEIFAILTTESGPFLLDFILLFSI
jgi:hypothetical protein